MKRRTWAVRLFYSKTHEQAGQEALGVYVIGSVQRDMEVAAGVARPDIGRAEVKDLGPESDGEWWVVYNEDTPPPAPVPGESCESAREPAGSRER